MIDTQSTLLLLQPSKHFPSLLILNPPYQADSPWASEKEYWRMNNSPWNSENEVRPIGTQNESQRKYSGSVKSYIK